MVVTLLGSKNVFLSSLIFLVLFVRLGGVERTLLKSSLVSVCMYVCMYLRVNKYI
jgi:hypothetical protein